MRQSGGLSLAADESGGNTMILSSPVAGTIEKERAFALSFLILMRQDSNPSKWGFCYSPFFYEKVLTWSVLQVIS